MMNAQPSTSPIRWQPTDVACPTCRAPRGVACSGPEHTDRDEAARNWIPPQSDTIPAPAPADLMTFDRAVASCEWLVLWLTAPYKAQSYYEDMVQTAYVGLFRAVETWRNDGGSTFATWARCCIRDVLRSARRLEIRRGMTMGGGTRRGRDLSIASIDSVDAFADRETPEALYVSAEDAHDVRSAVAMLSDRERTVLALRYEEDMTQGEAGAVLGISSSGVGWNEKRAIERLRVSAGVPEPTKRTITLYEYNGQPLSLADLSRVTGIDKSTLSFRIVRRGMSVQDAIETPVGYRRARPRRHAA